MLEIDGERDDLHSAPSFTLVKAAACQLGNVKLDRLGQAIDDVIPLGNLAGEFAVIVHDGRHDLAQSAALANKLARIAWTALAQERSYKARIMKTAA
jgi:hypothetical protein